MRRLSPTEVLEFLQQVPSETSQGERLLLFNYFQNRWDGTGAVVELGPFLGGTTRAIALGMSRNPRRTNDAVFHTFDRFDIYYTPEDLRRTIEPLVQSKVFTAEQANDLCRSADYERLFMALHHPHSYSELLRLHNRELPDYPGKVDSSTALDLLKDAGPLAALFVDGCKSWSSTLYAMRTLLPKMRPNAPVIFQDFGWYTCYWVSAFVHALRDYFELETSVDSTYFFRLVRPITADVINQRFATTPEKMGLDFFYESSQALLESSLLANDRRGELIAQLHLVAALVSMHRKDLAAAVLKKVEARRYLAHIDMIQGCLRSPTYWPDGTKIEWKSNSSQAA
jgi:hypothetical protein